MYFFKFDKFDKLDTSNFKMLYTTYVHPHLEYCLQVQDVGPYMVQDFQLLERVQQRATKQVMKIRHLPYKQTLRKLGIPSIEERAL